MSFAHRQPARQAGALDRRYRMELPNLLDDLDLSPHAFRLFCHLKRVCGAGATGVSWQSTKTLAVACRMSAGAVSAAKKELLQPRPELNGKSLISITRHGNSSDRIHIVDIWDENAQAFDSKSSKANRHLHLVNADVHIVNEPRSQYETKKKSVSKDEERTHEEERESRALALPPSTALPADFVITPEMRAWATERLPFMDVDLEHEQFIDACRERGIRSADWQSSWRKFMRRSLQFSQPHRPPAGSAADARDRRLRERDYAGSSAAAAAEILEGGGRGF